MIDTLESGAGNLTLADMNTEAANLLALQTRQSAVVRTRCRWPRRPTSRSCSSSV